MKFYITIMLLIIGYSSYCQDSLWIMPAKTGYGFINKNGECIIQPKYKYVHEFHDGLAFFEDSISNGFINTHGEIVFHTKYKTYFSEDLAFIKINDSIGFINKKGEITIRPRYGNYLVGCSNCFFYFSEGLAPVVITINDTSIWYRFIYIDKKGKVVFNQTFKNAENFSEGLAFVTFNSGNSGYINKNGEIVIKLKSIILGNKFSEGYASLTDKDYNCYFIDKQGKKLCPYTFRDAESFSDGMAAVRFNDNFSNWGYINCKGELVIKPQYSRVTKFSDGLAVVQKRDIDYINNHVILSYIIDKNGNIKFGPFKDTFFLEFRNGLALGTKNLTNDYTEYFYINTNGKIVWRDTLYIPIKLDM